MSEAGERTPTAAEVFDLVAGPPTRPTAIDRLVTVCVGIMLALVLLFTVAAVVLLLGYGALWAFLGILDLLEAAR